MATKVYTPTAVVVDAAFSPYSPGSYGFSGIDGTGAVLAAGNAGDYYFTNDVVRSLGWTPVDDSSIPLTAVVTSATFRNQVNISRQYAVPYQIKGGVALQIGALISAPTGTVFVDRVTTTDVGGGPLTVGAVLGTTWTLAFALGSGGANNFWFESLLTLVFVLASPVVTTGLATGANLSSATLNGTINPNGATASYPVSYQFQYGPTTSYGYTTPLVTNLTGSSNITAVASLTGLSGNSVYHFRLVGINADGSTYGSDQTFITGFVDIPIMVL